MAFKFPLSTVLQVRRIHEEREESVLRQILHGITQALAEAREVDAKIGRLNSERAEERLMKIAGRDLHWKYGELSQLQQHRKELQRHLDKLEDLKDKQLRIYEAARHSRETLTDMYDQQKKVYTFESGQREQKALDDNFIARRVRGSQAA